MNWRELWEKADSLSRESIKLREEAQKLWEKEQQRTQIVRSLREAAAVLKGGEHDARDNS